MRTATDIERLKRAQESSESAVSGLPPAYIYGLDISISSGCLYIGAGVANIRGRLACIRTRTIVEQSQWIAPKLPNSGYYVYLSESAVITVERIEPGLDVSQYYKQNPMTGSRFIGEVQTDEDGNLYRVLSRDPILIGGTTVFEEGYDPRTKVDSVGGRYASAGDGASRLEIFPDSTHALRIRMWDESGSTYRDVVKAIISGPDEGDFVIGEYDSDGNGAKWDESEATFKVRGKVYQENGQEYPQSTFFYDDPYPPGPYKANDFWVHDGVIYISRANRDLGEGLLADWDIFIRSNIITTIWSSNGDMFKIGQSSSTTLWPRVFRNGFEITDEIDDSKFRWKRKSFYPAAYPNDDETWNANHASGYRTVDIDTGTIEARATFTVEILD
jgi:hypothetical protein